MSDAQAPGDGGAAELNEAPTAADDAQAAAGSAAAGAMNEGNGDEGEAEGRAGAEGAAASEEDSLTMGCEHYRRRCKLVAPCCGEVFWCRFCHDEVKDMTADPKKNHTLTRQAVREVECGVCGRRQLSAERCVDTECGTVFGAYTCLKCNFFDDVTSKQQYHCDKCGLCRVGGRDNFFHCDKCQCCLAANLRNNHTCTEGHIKRNCPICMEYLFTSRSAPIFLNCGHAIHNECFNALLKNNLYRCPVCNKASGDMSAYWERVQAEIDATPMPEEYRNKTVRALCNDCLAKTVTPFHVFGLRCQECSSFNTQRIGDEE